MQLYLGEFAALLTALCWSFGAIFYTVAGRYLGAVTINRLDDGTYVDVNECFCRITGYRRAEVIGNSSLVLGVWNDPDGRKYHEAYFARFPGAWHHGDWARLTAHGGLVIYGRSDAVLNPGGVRIGTAEIYRQVEKLDEVVESLAIGQDWQGDQRIVLFVRLREGLSLDSTLAGKIRKLIRDNTTPRHVPAKILQVSDIPRTISGKIVELAVRNAVHGRPVKNTDALANPAALAEYRDRPELAED